MNTRNSILLLLCAAAVTGAPARATEPIWKDNLGWIALEGLKPVRSQGSKWFTSSTRMTDPIKVLGKRYQREQYIASHTNGEITYELALKRKISGFRAVAGLMQGGTKGSVIFKIKAGDKIVFKSPEVAHYKGNIERIEISFPPSDSITLITDPNGSDHQDWSVWLDAQVKSGN